MVPPCEFVYFDDHNEEGDNIFHCLCRDGSAESLQSLKMLINDFNSYLLRQFDTNGQQCIHIAASRNTAVGQAIFKLLVRWGADVNTPDKSHGDTPLHIAAYAGNQRLVKWISQLPGVVINVFNLDGKTPLRIADEQKNLSIAELLQAHGAYCTSPAEGQTRGMKFLE